MIKTHAAIIAAGVCLLLALPWRATAQGSGAALFDPTPATLEGKQRALDALRQTARRDVRALWRAHRRAALQPAWLVEGRAERARPAVEMAMRGASARLGHLKAEIEALDKGEPALVFEPETVEPPPIAEVEAEELPAVAAVRDALAEEVLDKAPPVRPAPGPSLADQRGDLHPPMLFGRVIQPFGMVRESKRSKNKLRHTGVTIKAPGGHRVRAVGAGEVVYAKGFKGYGLMVIVEHAGGYHSIYARLKNILVVQGALVPKGAPLGTIGVTHSDPPPQIYFELRHEGRPLDPAGWFGAPGKYRR